MRIDPLQPDDLILAVEAFLACGSAHVVNHLAAHPTLIGRQDRVYRARVNRADLNVADGMGVVWACRLQGFQGMRGRVYGPEFVLRLAEWGEPRGLRHAFVGGTPESIGHLLESLRGRYPEIRIVGSVAPPFREVTDEAVLEDLSALGGDADVLWVGLGTPKQQVWADIARRHRPARVIATVGAAFDFLSGSKRQAPGWIQRGGLEWAYRTASEPVRLWRRGLLGTMEFAVRTAVHPRGVRFPDETSPASQRTSDESSPATVPARPRRSSDHGAPARTLTKGRRG